MVDIAMEDCATLEWCRGRVVWGAMIYSAGVDNAVVNGAVAYGAVVYGAVVYGAVVYGAVVYGAVAYGVRCCFVVVPSPSSASAHTSLYRRHHVKINSVPLSLPC